MANMGIPGFSRQATVQSALPAISLNNGRGMFGTGSAVHNVIQMRDQFVDRRFWNQQGHLGEFAVKVPQLSLIEAIFNDLPDNSRVGVLGAFNDFFSRMQSLSREAHDPTFRLNVVMTGETLTRMIRTNAELLQQQQRDINGEVRAIVTEINGLGNQIATLNRQIRHFELHGSHANDLRDQRNLLIDRLSEFVNVEVRERDMSAYSGLPNDVRLSVLINGHELVQHDTAHRLELIPRTTEQRRNAMDVDGLYDIRWSHGTLFDIHCRHLRGTLKGLIDVRDGNGGQLTVTGQNIVQRQLNMMHSSIRTVERFAAGFSTDSILNSFTTFYNRLNSATTPLGLVQQLDHYQALIDAAVGMPAQRDTNRAALDAPATTVGSLAFNLAAAQDALAAAQAADPQVPADIENAQLAVTAAQAAITTAQTAYDEAVAAIALAENAATQVTRINAEMATVQAQMAGIVTNLRVDIDNMRDAMEAALASAEEARDILEARIAAIIAGDEPGFPHYYEVLLAQVEAYIDEIVNNDLLIDALAAMTAAYDALEGVFDDHLDPVANPGFAGGFDPGAAIVALEPILQALEGALADGAVVDDFLTEIRNIFTASNDMDVLPGRETTIFKGIPFYQNRLNDMVRVFVLAINEGLYFPYPEGDQIPGMIGHRNGWSLDGTTGKAFFTWIDPLTGDVIDDPANIGLLNSLNFDINQILVLQPHLLQCSSAPNLGQSDNAIIRDFINVGNHPSLFREGRLLDYIIATASHLAIDQQQSRRFLNNYTEMTIATQNQRASISDVDMNEELMNMMRFSHLFQVNARMMATMNEVYDTLINRLGI